MATFAHPFQFDLVDLRLFVHVVEASSITNGAKNSFLSPAAASMRLKNLESAVGDALLVKTKKGITPTQSGLVFLHHSRQVLNQLENLHSDLEQQSKGVAAPVRLFANASAFAEFLPKVLAAFVNAHPHVKFQLEEHPSRAIVRSLHSNSVDIGIVIGDARTEGLQVLPYQTDRLVLATSSRHRLASKQRIEFSEALDEDFIGHYGSAMDILAAESGSSYGRELKPRMLVGSFDSMCQLIEQNLGVGLVPHTVAKREAARASIAILELADAWAVREFKICVRSVAGLPDSARKFLEFLEAAK